MDVLPPSRRPQAALQQAPWTPCLATSGTASAIQPCRRLPDAGHTVGLHRTQILHAHLGISHLQNLLDKQCLKVVEGPLGEALAHAGQGGQWCVCHGSDLCLCHAIHGQLLAHRAQPHAAGSMLLPGHMLALACFAWSP